MKRIISAFVFFVLLLSLSWAASGESIQYAHAVACKIETSEGSAKELTDHSFKTYWQSQNDDSEVKVFIPSDEVPGYLRLEWFGECDEYELLEYGAQGDLLRARNQDDAYRGIQIVYELLPDTREIILKLPVKGTWIAGIYVYSAGVLPDSVHGWEPPLNEVDFMVVSAHQDDEFIYMGGSIPYAIATGHKTSCVYITSCGRVRRNEALNGLYAAGMRNYPEFLNFPDKRPGSVEEMAEIWGEESVLEALVRTIRKYRPKVIVTHDRHGEYGHPAHKLTAKLTYQAVEMAADPKVFEDSAAQYGAHQVQKLYLHLYDENEIIMDWKQPLDYYGGKTAFEMAQIGYNEHPSQHGNYQVEDGGKYDNAAFGLLVTHVGEDDAKNDFFEHVVFQEDDPAEPELPKDETVEEILQPEKTSGRNVSAILVVIVCIAVLGGGLAAWNMRLAKSRRRKGRRRV